MKVLGFEGFFNAGFPATLRFRHKKPNKFILLKNSVQFTYAKCADVMVNWSDKVLLNQPVSIEPVQ
jgi:hypothetical protein